MNSTPLSIVFLDAATFGDESLLKPLHSLGTFTSYPFTSPGEEVARMGNHPVVLTNKVVLNKNILEQCKNLKLICITATGTNNVDLEAAAALGIEVRNVVNFSTYSVAQFTFSLLLTLVHRPLNYHQYIQQGHYSAQPSFTYIGHNFCELAGKTFGIIGLGNIGKQVAAIATAFGANVMYYSSSGEDRSDLYARVSLNELLQQADYVSVHAPLNDKTRNLVAAPELKQMKPGALLLNTGRGGIVNEEDLVTALNSEAIAGAAVDVFTAEPLPESHPYLSVNNPEKLLLTPHVTWASVEARRRAVGQIMSHIKAFQVS